MRRFRSVIVLHYAKVLVGLKNPATHCDYVDRTTHIYSSTTPGALALICLAFNNSSQSNKLLAIPAALAIEFLSTLKES